MNERKIRRYPPIAVSLVVTAIFMVTSVGAIKEQAEEIPQMPEWSDGYMEGWLAYTSPADEETAGTATEVTDPEPEVVETVTPEPETAYTYYDVPLDDSLQEYAQDLCAEYGFPRYDIIVALIGHESSYREAVVSRTDDYGYMQINAVNHEWLKEELGVTDILDGRQNIRSGIYILQGLYHKYGDIGLALMAYNCGERGAELLWEDGVFSTNYSRSIQQEAAELTVRKG